MIKKIFSQRHTLTFRIMTGMLLGFICGVILNYGISSEFISTSTQSWLIGGFFNTGGKIFISLLKMLVVPLVFVSLVVGTASLDDIRKIGRVGGKTLILYILTTAIAVTSAISIGLIFKPGSGLNITSEHIYQPKEAPSLGDVIVNIIPTNPFKAMVDGEMLQIIFFAIFFGFALALTKSKTEPLLNMFKDVDTVIMRMVMVLIHFAPYGVFFLMTKVFASEGFTAVLPLAKYFILVLLALFIHFAFVFSFLLKFIARLNPITFIKKFKGVLAFAFSTSSSNATIPVTIENVTTKLGVSNSIASFTVPLGATINMDGTAIMQGMATVFIAQVYGVDIGLVGYLTVVLTATLASVGTAGVPGVGLITLAMVLRQVNLPTEGIALIIGVDRLLDMARTMVNVTGDAVVSCLVAKSEGQLDLQIFNSDPETSNPELV